MILNVNNSERENSEIQDQLKQSVKITIKLN